MFPSSFVLSFMNDRTTATDNDTTPTNELLNLEDNQELDAIGICSIINNLKHNTCITRLWLNNVKSIDLQCCHLLSDILKVNTTLERLFFSDNNIGDEGLQALCYGTNKGEENKGGLYSNTTTRLNWMSLSRNNIGNAGCYALADVFKTNTSLQKLYLSGNHPMDNKGMDSMANSLRLDNTTLIYLDVDSTPTTHAGKEKIDFYTRMNQYGRNRFLHPKHNRKQPSQQRTKVASSSTVSSATTTTRDDFFHNTINFYEKISQSYWFSKYPNYHVSYFLYILQLQPDYLLSGVCHNDTNNQTEESCPTRKQDRKKRTHNRNNNTEGDNTTNIEQEHQGQIDRINSNSNDNDGTNKKRRKTKQ